MPWKNFEIHSYAMIVGDVAPFSKVSLSRSYFDDNLIMVRLLWNINSFNLAKPTKRTEIQFERRKRINKIEKIRWPQKMILFTAYLLLFFCNNASALTTGCISACNPTCACSFGDIEISSSVTNIGDYAFLSKMLVSVTIPSSVTSIGAGAFMENQLTSVIIPSYVSRITDFAFRNNKIASVVISSSVTSIKHEAFRYNELNTVYIPSSVTEIVSWAFLDNPLTSVCY